MKANKIISALSMLITLVVIQLANLVMSVQHIYRESLRHPIAPITKAGFGTSYELVICSFWMHIKGGRLTIPGGGSPSLNIP